MQIYDTSKIGPGNKELSNIPKDRRELRYTNVYSERKHALEKS